MCVLGTKCVANFQKKGTKCVLQGPLSTIYQSVCPYTSISICIQLSARPPSFILKYIYLPMPGGINVCSLMNLYQLCLDFSFMPTTTKYLFISSCSARVSVYIPQVGDNLQSFFSYIQPMLWKFEPKTSTM